MTSPRDGHAGESAGRQGQRATLGRRARQALANEANKQRQAAARQKALAEDKRRQEESAAIRRIWVQYTLLAAPLDAILAKIECDNIAHKANERQRAATWDKALADEANELRQAAAAREKALADEAYE